MVASLEAQGRGGIDRSALLLSLEDLARHHVGETSHEYHYNV